MARRASDFVKQFQIISIALSPNPNSSGDITVSGANPTLTATVLDPASATPYTYDWIQFPITDGTVSFSNPSEASTQIGPLVAGHAYYVQLTVTNAALAPAVRTFRILAT